MNAAAVIADALAAVASAEDTRKDLVVLFNPSLVVPAPETAGTEAEADPIGETILLRRKAASNAANLATSRGTAPKTDMAAAVAAGDTPDLPTEATDTEEKRESTATPETETTGGGDLTAEATLPTPRDETHRKLIFSLKEQMIYKQIKQEAFTHLYYV
jgi:hypothetical protein